MKTAADLEEGEPDFDESLYGLVFLWDDFPGQNSINGQCRPLCSWLLGCDDASVLPQSLANRENAEPGQHRSGTLSPDTIPEFSTAICAQLSQAHWTLVFKSFPDEVTLGFDHLFVKASGLWILMGLCLVSVALLRFVAPFLPASWCEQLAKVSSQTHFPAPLLSLGAMSEVGRWSELSCGVCVGLALSVLSNFLCIAFAVTPPVRQPISDIRALRLALADGSYRLVDHGTLFFRTVPIFLYFTQCLHFHPWAFPVAQIESAAVGTANSGWVWGHRATDPRGWSP